MFFHFFIIFLSKKSFFYHFNVVQNDIFIIFIIFTRKNYSPPEDIAVARPVRERLARRVAEKAARKLEQQSEKVRVVTSVLLCADGHFRRLPRQGAI